MPIRSRTFMLLLGTLTLVLFGNNLLIAQTANCPNQTCSVGANGCFMCSGSDGMSCGWQDCSTCLEKICSSGSGGPKMYGLCMKPLPRFPQADSNIVPASSHDGKPEPEGFTFLPISNKEDPAILTAVGMNNKEGLVLGAEFQNSSRKTITAYQFGWVVGSSPDDTKLTLMPKFEIPDGLAPDASHKIPPSPFSPSLIRPGVRAAFFIAKVQFSDGTSWSADLKKIKKEALFGSSREKTIPSAGNRI